MSQKHDVINLLELMQEISDDQKELSDVIGENEYLFSKVDVLGDVILDMLGVPEDNSLQYDRKDDEFFTRDPYYQTIYDYTLRLEDYTAEAVYWELKTLKDLHAETSIMS